MVLLSHLENGSQLNDRNFDGFLDTPLKNDIILRNEWHYRGDKGVVGEYSITGLRKNSMAGQKSTFDPDLTDPFTLFDNLVSVWQVAFAWMQNF